MSINLKNVDIEKDMPYNSTYFYGKPLSERSSADYRELPVA